VSGSNQFITAEHVSADPDYFPSLVQPKIEYDTVVVRLACLVLLIDGCRCVSRAVCITDSPLR
jgi:hypothetical protein